MCLHSHLKIQGTVSHPSIRATKIIDYDLGDIIRIMQLDNQLLPSYVKGHLPPFWLVYRSAGPHLLGPFPMQTFYGRSHFLDFNI